MKRDRYISNGSGLRTGFALCIQANPVEWRRWSDSEKWNWSTLVNSEGFLLPIYWYRESTKNLSGLLNGVPSTKHQTTAPQGPRMKQSFIRRKYIVLWFYGGERTHPLCFDKKTRSILFQWVVSIGRRPGLEPGICEFESRLTDQWFILVNI